MITNGGRRASKPVGGTVQQINNCAEVGGETSRTRVPTLLSRGRPGAKKRGSSGGNGKSGAPKRGTGYRGEKFFGREGRTLRGFVAALGGSASNLPEELQANELPSSASAGLEEGETGWLEAKTGGALGAWPDKKFRGKMVPPDCKERPCQQGATRERNETAIEPTEWGGAENEKKHN